MERRIFGDIVCFTVDNKDYYFHESIVKDSLVRKIYNDESFRRNYDILNNIMGEWCSFGRFIVYYLDFLNEEFIQALDFDNSKDNLRFDDRNGKDFFDPIVQPCFRDSLFTEDDLACLQYTLIRVYKKRGKEGLRDLRTMNFAQGILSTRYIEIEDPEDLYDLPVYQILPHMQNCKVITLSTSFFSPVRRTMDFLETKLRFDFPNENIKSALFEFPHLLYNEQNELLNDFMILDLYDRIERKMTDKKTKTLNYDSFWEASYICDQIYLEDNLDKYYKSKQKTLTSRE